MRDNINRKGRTFGKGIDFSSSKLGDSEGGTKPVS